jgi:hypothetical protein
MSRRQPPVSRAANTPTIPTRYNVLVLLPHRVPPRVTPRETPGWWPMFDPAASPAWVNVR